jgi:uncharacterized protein YebE (UPF0316 family)
VALPLSAIAAFSIRTVYSFDSINYCLCRKELHNERIFVANRELYIKLWNVKKLFRKEYYKSICNVICLKEMVTTSITLCIVHAKLHKIAAVERDLSASALESGVTEILRL